MAALNIGAKQSLMHPRITTVLEKDDGVAHIAVDSVKTQIHNLGGI